MDGRYGLYNKSCTNMHHNIICDRPAGVDINENYNVYYLDWYYQKYNNFVNGNGSHDSYGLRTTRI